MTLSTATRLVQHHHLSLKFLEPHDSLLPCLPTPTSYPYTGARKDSYKGHSDDINYLLKMLQWFLTSDSYSACKGLTLSPFPPIFLTSPQTALCLAHSTGVFSDPQTHRCAAAFGALLQLYPLLRMFFVQMSLKLMPSLLLSL